MVPLRLLTSVSASLLGSLSLLCTAAGAQPRPASPGPPARVTAALGEGLTARSADGRFDLTLRARMQLRGTFLSAPPESTDEAVQGAEVRRMRLVLQGRFYSPHWRYYVQLGFSNGDTEPDLRLPLRDAAVFWTRFRDLNLRVGQGKVPFNHQRVVSSSNLAMVDRSLVQLELNLDRDVGLMVSSNDLFGLGGRLGYRLGLFGGDGRNRVSTGSGLLYIARVMVSPLGRGFDEGPENDLDRDPHPRLNLGASVAYNDDSRRARSTFGDTFILGGFDTLSAEADLLFKWRGFVVAAEWLYRESRDAPRTVTSPNGSSLTERPRNAWGYFVQAGYAWSPRWDTTLRWGDLRPLGEASPVDRQRELGASVGWYGQGHAFKIQADYFYLAGEDFHAGRHQARMQIQLYF